MPLDTFIWLLLIIFLGHWILRFVADFIQEKREKKKYFFSDYLLEELSQPLSGSHWLIVPPILLVFFNSKGLLLDITVWIVLVVLEIVIFLLLYMFYRRELKRRSRK